MNPSSIIFCSPWGDVIYHEGGNSPLLRKATISHWKQFAKKASFEVFPSHRSTIFPCKETAANEQNWTSPFFSQQTWLLPSYLQPEGARMPEVNSLSAFLSPPLFFCHHETEQKRFLKQLPPEQCCGCRALLLPTSSSYEEPELTALLCSSADWQCKHISFRSCKLWDRPLLVLTNYTAESVLWVFPLFGFLSLQALLLLGLQLQSRGNWMHPVNADVVIGLVNQCANYC